jgi:hypothetical protein
MESALVTINHKLGALKARAAKINSDINSSPTKEIKKARVAEYMAISASIAELKQQAILAKDEEKTNAQAAAKAANKFKSDTKIFTLLFPAESRVQYFASTAGVVEVLLLLQEVFESSVPAITSVLHVTADQVVDIPKEWYELINEKDEV